MNRRGLFAFLGVSPIAVAGAALATTRKNDAPDPGPDIALHRNGQSVILAPGKDGHLWVKVGGGWHRVVTE